jgi:hypothetical protein
MNSIEMYMTMFFLFFMFFFFIMMVAKVQRSMNMSKFSATAHDMVFEIAERVSSSEFLVASSPSGQKKTAVFDPIKLSTANYDDLKEYLQENRIDWEIEVFDLEGDYREKIDKCYKDYAQDMEDCEDTASECRLRANEEPTRNDREREIRRCQNGAVDCRLGDATKGETRLSNCRKEERRQFDCSPGTVDWDKTVNSVGTTGQMCENADGCAAAYPGWLTPNPDPGTNLMDPSVHVNIDCMRCAYWRIGPSDRNLQELREGRQKRVIKRKIIYEFPAAISYYCDGRPTTLRTKPVHLAVLRVAAIEYDW